MSRGAGQGSVWLVCDGGLFGGGPQVNKLEQAQVMGTWPPPLSVDRQTGMSENITITQLRWRAVKSRTIIQMRSEIINLQKRFKRTLQQWSADKLMND